MREICIIMKAPSFNPMKGCFLSFLCNRHTIKGAHRESNASHSRYSIPRMTSLKYNLACSSDKGLSVGTSITGLRIRRPNRVSHLQLTDCLFSLSAHLAWEEYPDQTLLKVGGREENRVCPLWRNACGYGNRKGGGFSINYDWQWQSGHF